MSALNILQWIWVLFSTLLVEVYIIHTSVHLLHQVNSPYLSRFNCYYDFQMMIWTRPQLIHILGCNEVVTWVNFKRPIGISSSQVNILEGQICEYSHYWNWKNCIFSFLCWQLSAFRNLEGHDGNPLADNFRPPQPLNGRLVGCGQFSD